MKRWLLEYLVCPNDECRGKLEMEVFASHYIEKDDERVEEIDEALIICKKCGRWYPVIDRITCMLPDEKRLEPSQLTKEKAFLEKWRERVPREILLEGKPFGLE